MSTDTAPAAPATAPDPAAVRCVIVVDDALPPGLAANAAAVLALTLGATVPALVGPDVVAADGERHPGLIDRGLPVLRAAGADLAALRRRALDADLGVVGLPAAAQQTTDYDAFRARVAATASDDLGYLALLVHGPKRPVARLTGSLPLLR